MSLTGSAARVDELYRVVVERHSGERRNRGVNAPDLIDELLNLHESGPSFLSEADLKVSVLDPFIAALDTVASTGSFMLCALLCDSDLLAAARAEADALFADGEPAWSDVEKMDVLHRTTLETMRMYPAVPMLVRTVTNSFELAGYRLKTTEVPLPRPHDSFRVRAIPRNANGG